MEPKPTYGTYVWILNLFIDTHRILSIVHFLLSWFGLANLCLAISWSEVGYPLFHSLGIPKTGCFWHDHFMVRYDCEFYHQVCYFVVVVSNPLLIRYCEISSPLLIDESFIIPQISRLWKLFRRQLVLSSFLCGVGLFYSLLIFICNLEDFVALDCCCFFLLEFWMGSSYCKCYVLPLSYACGCIAQFLCGTLLTCNMFF